MMTEADIREHIQRKVEEFIRLGDVDRIEMFSENLMRMLMACAPEQSLYQRYMKAMGDGVLSAGGDDSKKQKALILSVRGSRRALGGSSAGFERVLKRAGTAAASAVKDSLLFGKTGIYYGKSWGHQI